VKSIKRNAVKNSSARAISKLLKMACVVATCLGIIGCVGVNQISPAPVGLHPEDAPTPSGKKLSD
jgi:hypothetical protein